MRLKRAVISLVLALLVAGIWLALRPNRSAVQRRPDEAALTPPPNAGAAESGDSLLPSRSATDVPTISNEDLESVRRLIAESSDLQRTKALLDQLSGKLRAISSEKAAGVLLDALSNRSDVATKLPFAIGDGGRLTTAPTFRVWLLDQLGRTNPEAAAGYAQSILTTRESADEWAVALRDFAKVRSAPADVAYVNGKVRELLNEPRWQSEQSVGWLEAFDVAVHNRAIELTPDLAQLVTRTSAPDKPAAYAAFLTLDRLVQAAPVEMLSRLQAEPELMKGRELTRANYFSRANVGEPRQREIVELYLLDAGRSQEELSKFAGLYPNANGMVSKNLLTPTITPSREELVLHDREALKVAGEWLNDPRFSAIHPHIEAIHTRLSEFVRQAGN